MRYGVDSLRYGVDNVRYGVDMYVIVETVCYGVRIFVILSGHDEISIKAPKIGVSRM